MSWKVWTKVKSSRLAFATSVNALKAAVVSSGKNPIARDERCAMQATKQTSDKGLGALEVGLELLGSGNHCASMSVVATEHAKQRPTGGGGSSLLLHVLDDTICKRVINISESLNAVNMGFRLHNFQTRLARAVVVRSLAVAENLQCWVSADTEAAGQLRLNGGVDLGQEDGRVVFLERLGGNLVLRGQALAVSTPCMQRRGDVSHVLTLLFDDKHGAKNSTRAIGASCKKKEVEDAYELCVNSSWHGSLVNHIIRKTIT